MCTESRWCRADRRSRWLQSNFVHNLHNFATWQYLHYGRRHGLNKQQRQFEEITTIFLEKEERWVKIISIECVSHAGRHFADGFRVGRSELRTGNWITRKEQSNPLVLYLNTLCSHISTVQPKKVHSKISIFLFSFLLTKKHHNPHSQSSLAVAHQFSSAHPLELSESRQWAEKSNENFPQSWDQIARSASSAPHTNATARFIQLMTFMLWRRRSRWWKSECSFYA